MPHINRLRLALALSFSLALPIACAKEAPTPSKRPRPVKTALVGAGGDSGERAVSGSVISRDATQLSFRVGGPLLELKIKMGDTVVKGQLLGKLDDSDYQVALSQAQANYQNAKTQKGTAQSAFDRTTKMFEAGSSSQADFERAKGNLQAAKAQLSASGQTVKQARNQTEYAVLKSPFAGVINSVTVKAGESIQPGQAIVVVSRGGELEIAVGLPEIMVSSVKVGTKAEIRVSALGAAVYPGIVREVGFASESSTYPTRVALETPNEALRPGMAASATFDYGTKSAAISIPAGGVANSEDGTFVFVIEKASGDHYTVKRRSVEIGELMGNAFEVREGLKSGERVAVAGLGSLVEGMTVRLLEAAPAKSTKTSAPTEPPAPTKPATPGAPE